mgnify:CR=1 FL=1
MANRVIIKNNLEKLKNDELAKKIEREAKRKMLWGFQKDRLKEKEEKSQEENPEK